MPSRRLLNPPFRPRPARLLPVLAVAASFAIAGPARADDVGWPRQFDSSSGSFVIYQPQPEDLDGDLLTGRAAFSLKKSKDATPAFGVLWYVERIEVDRDSSTVIARRLDVTKVRLPGITAAEASRYEALVESQSTRWDLSGSVEELRAGLAAAEKERESIAGLDNAPPRILFHDRRAILVVYDGAPVLEPIDDSDLERVVNTPYAVVFHPRSRSYYLNGANLWYEAKDPLGPWTSIPDPPDIVREVVPPDTSAYDQVEGPPPEVLTATEPTELIATDGEPRFAPLVGDELLYIANTESDVLLEVETQSFYVLISGRWFRAAATDGRWTFVRGDRLPESFKRVPPDSPKGHVLASVAGTDQAADALADAAIPQTSAIRRDDRSFNATYDGDPEFEPIEGTDLEYAVNTDSDVILADGRYYACDQGVWYIADDPEGPWYVSDTRPLGLEDIPPSCPLYDVRYVYVYDSTPDAVYVGYLPGYLGCYPSYGTVVYGTGHRYRAWRSRQRYYPHRFTWGFHARYNPWLSRWSFGFSYGSGFLRVGTRWRSHARDTRPRSSWFGPGGYRRPLVAPDLTLLRARRQRGTRTRWLDGLQANVYSRPENVTRVDRVRVRSVVRSIARPVPSPNDVFAGQDGKVYRRDPGGKWGVRTGTEWKPTSLPTPPPPAPVVRGEEVILPSTGPSESVPGRRRGEPAVERRIRQPSEPPVPAPTPERERPAPPRERPAPPPEQPAQERERPAPPQEKPTPGDLEREYRARQRADQEDTRDKPRQRAQKEESQREKRPPRTDQDGPGRNR